MSHLSYIKLDSFFVEQHTGGLNVGGLRVTVELDGGATVDVLAPFIAIGGGLAVTPMIKGDGATALHIDLECWSPARITSDVVARFPLNVNDQAMAIKICRAFDADPTTSWTDPVPAVKNWLRNWGPDNGLTF